MNMLEFANGCHTKVDYDKLEYTWKITNFHYLKKKPTEFLESPIFTTKKHESLKWSLQFYPNGINHNYSNCVSVYLNCKKEIEKNFTGYFLISIINGVDDSVLKIEKKDFENTTVLTSWGFPNFIQRSKLLHTETDAQKFIVLRCEILLSGNCHFYSEIIEESDQFVEEDLLKGLKILFLDEKLSDVKLITSCGKEINAHKAILGAASPIFLAMFEHQMKESASNVVEISDIEYNILKEMIRFIYTRKVVGLKTIAIKLLVAADKYQILKLKKMCEISLYKKISIDNVIDIYIISDRLDLDLLKSRAVDFIKFYMMDVVKTEGFKSLEKMHIANFIRIIQDTFF